MQQSLYTLLGVEPLPRIQDRVTKIQWIQKPLVYETPRFGTTETPREAGVHRGWLVALSQELQTVSSHLLTWVLWREALLSLLLPHIRQVPEAADLGLYAGFKFGDYTPQQKDALIELWQQVSPLQYHQYYTYDAPFGFSLFDPVVDGTFLHRAIPWLNTLRTTTLQTPLASPTYIAALERWMLETHIPLTATELRTLNALNNITTLKQTHLAQQLCLTPSTLSQVLNNLAQKHLLRFFNSINLPLIGLIPQEVILRIASRNKRSRMIFTFSKIRYLHSIYNIQDDVLLCRFFIPYNKINQFNHWLHELISQEDITNFLLIQDSEIFLNWNFNSYISETGWPNDFSLTLSKLQFFIHNYKENEMLPIQTSSYSYDLLQNKHKFPLHLRIEDFTFFRRSIDVIQITDRVSSQPSQEARKAGLSETAHMRYRRRVQKLERMNVSDTLGILLLHVGLDTVIQIILYEPRETTERIFRTFQVLPFINGIILENGNGRCFIYIPNHTAVDTLSILRRSLALKEINVEIGVTPAWQSFSGFQSPVAITNYDLEEGDWKWNENTLPTNLLKK